MVVRAIVFCILACLMGGCKDVGRQPYGRQMVICLHSVDISSLGGRLARETVGGACELAGDKLAGAVGLYANPSNLIYFAERVSDRKKMLAFRDEMKSKGASEVGFVQLSFGSISEVLGAGSVCVRQELFYRVVDVKGKILLSAAARAEGSRKYQNSGKDREKVVTEMVLSGVDRMLDEAARRICEFCDGRTIEERKDEE